MSEKIQAVLDFWFKELTPEDWFTKNADLDEQIKQRFFDCHQKIVALECEDWRETPEGALAYVIVLDQFSRNMFRGTPESFAYDAQAFAAAQNAVEIGFDKGIGEERRSFLYMPYMHSEDREVHETAIELFTDLGNEDNLKFEKLHKRIIDEFGRYPHRNEVLGRESTQEEIAFLKSDEKSSF